MEFDERARLQRPRFRGGATGIRNSDDSVVLDISDSVVLDISVNSSPLSSIAFPAIISEEKCCKRDVVAHATSDLSRKRSLLSASCSFTEDTAIRGVEVVEGKNDADINRLCRLAAFLTRPKSADNRCLRPKRSSASNKNHKIK